MAQKTKNGLTDTNRTAEQLQNQSAESGVDYAGSRIQEIEGQIGAYATYGMERIGGGDRDRHRLLGGNCWRE